MDIASSQTESWRIRSASHSAGGPSANPGRLTRAGGGFGRVSLPHLALSTRRREGQLVQGPESDGAERVFPDLVQSWLDAASGLPVANAGLLAKAAEDMVRLGYNPRDVAGIAARLHGEVLARRLSLPSGLSDTPPGFRLPAAGRCPWTPPTPRQLTPRRSLPPAASTCMCTARTV